MNMRQVASGSVVHPGYQALLLCPEAARPAIHLIGFIELVGRIQGRRQADIDLLNL
jgi:hypothetical protein